MKKYNIKNNSTIDKMDFKNDKITLSFYNFKKYLNSFNIEVTKELINSLCHEDYIVSDEKKDKEKYICKMKYSEERIKKANTERLRKKSKNKIRDEKDVLNINTQNQQIPKSDINSDENINHNVNNEDINSETHLKTISRDNLQNEICDSPIKNIHENDRDQNSQTARTSSYLFDETNLIYKNNNNSNEIDNQIPDIPSDILDIYEELDIKEQIIEGLENNVEKLRKEIIIRDKKISFLIKEVDNIKVNNCNFNREQLIDILNTLLKKQLKLHEDIYSFILSVESASPKNVNMVVNKNIINIKNKINSISDETNLINNKIVKLLNF